MADATTTTTTTNGASTSTNGVNTPPSHPLTWFITGTSSGFGYRLAKIALSRGDRVIATARSLTKVQKLVDEITQDVDKSKKDRLKVFKLDLGDSEEVVKNVVREAIGVWGNIDVLVNNAGTFFEFLYCIFYMYSIIMHG